MNGHDIVLLDTMNSPWRGEGPGDHCYEVCQIPRTRKRMFCLLHSITHMSKPPDYVGQ